MKFVIIITIAFVLLIPIATNLAFAQSETITVKIWFISSFDFGCTDRNQEALEFYEKLTQQYFLQYGFPIIQFDGECVKNSDVVRDGFFTGDISKYDLPILILDVFAGQIYHHEDNTKKLGHYRYSNFNFDNEAIVIASLSPYVESDQGAWILSHELSHYILHNKQYPESVWNNWVHTMQSKYDYCSNKDGCQIFGPPLHLQKANQLK